jgi:hypothetical protein
LFVNSDQNLAKLLHQEDNLTMAGQAPIRTALSRLGFSQAAATAITVQEQMGTLEDFALLSDEEAASLCRVIRKPGGMIANPNANAEGQLATIPNPGIAIPQKAENNLKLMCFLI